MNTKLHYDENQSESNPLITQNKVKSKAIEANYVEYLKVLDEMLNSRIVSREQHLNLRYKPKPERKIMAKKTKPILKGHDPK